MTNAVEVITSVQRRRRWSRAEKERIVAAAMDPGAVVSEIARAAGIHSSQLFRWRQELCLPAAAPSFSPVAVLPEPGAALPERSPVTGGIIELDFGTGGRMRITGPVEASMVNTALSTPMRRVGNGTRPSQSICRARTEAVRERLDRVRQARGISLADQLLTIGKDCAAHLKKPFRTIDHDVIWR